MRKFTRLFVVITLIFFLPIGYAAGDEDAANSTDPDHPYAWTPDSIEGKPGYSVQKERIAEREIPAYLVFADEFVDAEKPTVILIHGGGIFDVQAKYRPHAKEIWFEPWTYDLPYRLADRGMLVIVIDAWWAGERYTPDHLALVKKNMLGALLTGYFESAKDIPLIIDYLEAREDADATHVGVAGRSGGGIISLIAVGTEPRVTAIVGWVAGADLITMAHGKGWPGSLVNQMLDLQPGLREEILRTDAIHTYAAMPPRAVAIINNREDPAMPSYNAQPLYDKLKPLYAEFPERLSITFHDTPEPTHQLSEEAYMQGVNWFERFLVLDREVTPADR